MPHTIIGRIMGCYANHNPLEEADCPNFSGHIEVSTDEGNCDIQTDNPKSYLIIEAKACVSTPISLPVEKHEDHFHLMLPIQP